MHPPIPRYAPKSDLLPLTIIHIYPNKPVLISAGFGSECIELAEKDDAEAAAAAAAAAAASASSSSFSSLTGVAPPPPPSTFARTASAISRASVREVHGSSGDDPDKTGLLYRCSGHSEGGYGLAWSPSAAGRLLR